MLKFKDLHIGFIDRKSKQEHLLFKKNDLLFQPGDFVALVGPNGSGKTTLFNTILGFQKELQGEITFDETSLSQFKREEKVKLISFVPSKFSGVDHLSVYDLVAMGRAPYTNILNKLTAKDHQIVQAIIDKLNLNSLANNNTLSLSDGERQIAMIGKALAQEAKVMVLDEPTAFLDYNNRRKVLQILKVLAEQNNQLIFISSHDLDLCFEFCNKVIAIDKNEKVLKSYSFPFEKKTIVQEIFLED
ncbi:MAG TPA: ABC transporter ATP-binding protein [Brumimicrobium sp.]|nr:ABC transporter ATP-binding protein [Brumimicrobium sp.]